MGCCRLNRGREPVSITSRADWHAVSLVCPEPPAIVALMETKHDRIFYCLLLLQRIFYILWIDVHPVRQHDHVLLASLQVQIMMFVKVAKEVATIFEWQASSDCM